MRRLFLIGLFLAVPIILSAQPPVANPNSRLLWDQPEVSLASAQGDTYRYYPDNATTGIILASVTCTGTVSPFQCSVAFPTFTSGNHTLQLSAANAVESPKSLPFAFVYVAAPGVPTNIHIQ